MTDSKDSLMGTTVARPQPWSTPENQQNVLFFFLLTFWGGRPWSIIIFCVLFLGSRVNPTLDAARYSRGHQADVFSWRGVRQRALLHR